MKKKRSYKPKKHKYRVFVRLGDELVPVEVHSFSYQEARYKVMDMKKCSNSDITSVSQLLQLRN